MNSQSIGTLDQFAGQYRHDLLLDVFRLDGRSPRELAKDADLSHQKIYESLEGECKKIESLTSIVTALQTRCPKLQVKHLFDFEITRDRFRRTVLDGGRGLVGEKQRAGVG